MDPLSVTVSVATFLANCLITVTALKTLSPQYQHAVPTITSIVSETTILAAALAHIQQLLLINAPGLQDQGASGIELRQMFDTTLTACLITFSCLGEEVKTLTIKSADVAESHWRGKSRVVWKEEVMQELLRQIQDQQTTLGFLVQSLQMRSLSASNHYLGEARPLLQDTVSRSRSHRNLTLPSMKVPESIFEGRSSGAFLDGSSTIGSVEFDFDDDVVNSTVYRRAMATATKGQQDSKPRVKIAVEGDLIDLSEHGSDGGTEMAEYGARDLEELVPRDSSALRSSIRAGTMETLQEEQEPSGDSPRSQRTVAEQHSPTSAMGCRITGPVRMHLYPAEDTDGPGDMTPTLTIASNTGATVDSHSVKSIEARSRPVSGCNSPATAMGDAVSGAVNFSRKQLPPPPHVRVPVRSETVNGFYADTAASNSHSEEDSKGLKRSATLPHRRSGPAARLLEQQQVLQQAPRTSIPLKAARQLGVADRTFQSQKLAHIDEYPTSDPSRPESDTSRSSGHSSRNKVPVMSAATRSAHELAKTHPLDWNQPWNVFWRLTSTETQKAPRGHSVGLQELWWQLLLLEENYQNSLELLHSLISAEDASLPTCGITPLAIRKLQVSHDKHIRQPLRQAMGSGPWTFDYPAIVKAYQSAHAQLVPLYERFAWDLPLVTFQVAAASKPASQTSRDLLTSMGPGLPTRYTCFRSPLTHICSSFDTIQSLSDGFGHGSSRSTPNFAQVVATVREQLRSLIASCNRNILLRWDDLRGPNLSGSHASRDLGHVTKELIFPPSQRRNIVLLNLGSPTRAVISRADLHWKSSVKDSWSKCHAILLNNYLVLASVSDSKGPRRHQVYHLVALPDIATTTMSSDPVQAEKNASRKSKPGKPVYNLFVRTPEFEHILGFATMVHCLEWHEHLDVALRGEMMAMPTGIGGVSC
ncbi:hypothetical protein FKW77_007773 [Venturia effusa]|uniref:DH domain-containing protein n=1 Tax=Venturia effusa TaxID=50376 RepID=A0A517L5U8_9PEZI|nr:hypothetical protein FKW77_007773 [Venturia effusa]